MRGRRLGGNGKIPALRVSGCRLKTRVRLVQLGIKHCLFLEGILDSYFLPPANILKGKTALLCSHIAENCSKDPSNCSNNTFLYWQQFGHYKNDVSHGAAVCLTAVLQQAL